MIAFCVLTHKCETDKADVLVSADLGSKNVLVNFHEFAHNVVLMNIVHELLTLAQLFEEVLVWYF